MKTTDYIKMALENGKAYTLALLADLKDAPLTQPTPNGGNHPLWIVGHLARSESALLDVFILGKPNRFPELENCNAGSAPTPNASDYPSMEDLLVKFEIIRAASLAHLATLSEADLDMKSHAPEKYGAFFGTVGACYAAMTSHMAFHAGQVADARRALGRERLMR
ncbi:MAG: DinB family protein [Planctomycetales bacterium]|nr:DinB family protein [Planctomycetales bacterium]